MLSGGLHGGALVASYPFDNTPNSSKLAVFLGSNWLELVHEVVSMNGILWPRQVFESETNGLISMLNHGFFIYASLGWSFFLESSKQVFGSNWGLVT